MTSAKGAPLRIVLGLGITGLSCARYFSARGIPFIVMDTRPNPPLGDLFLREFPEVPLHLGALEEACIAGAHELILSPGLDPKLPPLQAAAKRGVSLIGDIELFARAARAPILAVTGTNGKGTVATLLATLLADAGKRVILGGNIGHPALNLLAQPTPDYYVLELSSFQLEATYSLKVQAAAFLNLSCDHLDRHGDMTAYCNAKQRIYQYCQFAVWNRNDEATYPLASPTQSISFGSNPPKVGHFGLLNYRGKIWLAFGERRLVDAACLKLIGCHNYLNALAALAIAHAIGLPLARLLTALCDFKGLPHRCEWVAERNCIVWINDSKGTNVGATLAALESIGPARAGKLILIAGGVCKGADFTPLYPAVARYARAVILMGQAASRLQSALQGAVPLYITRDLQSAVQQAAGLACPGDAVLLSPACASWDLFQDYAARGRSFVQAVHTLLGIT